jgi:hypothetical protein
MSLDLLSFYPYTVDIPEYTTDDEYRQCIMKLTTLENWASFTEKSCVDSMQPIYDEISLKYRYCTSNSLCVTILMSYEYLPLFHLCMQKYCFNQQEKEKKGIINIEEEKSESILFSQEECFQLLWNKIHK